MSGEINEEVTEEVKEEVKEEETKQSKKQSKKKKVKPKEKKVPKFDEELYVGPEFQNPQNKFKRSAAKFFDTTIDRVSEVATILNGRKIDGFIVNELIGRLGFFDLFRMNRQKVADKKNERDGSKSATIVSVDIASEKLKEIIHEPDAQKAYRNHVEGYTKEVNKEINDEAQQG